MSTELKVLFYIWIIGNICNALESGYHYQLPIDYNLNADYGNEDHNLQKLPVSNYNPSINNVEYKSMFYTVEAPDDLEEDVAQYEEKFKAALQNNLRVVFIKTPESKALEGAFNAIAKHSSEDKTAIYVLNKQTDIGELASKLRALQLQYKHKPEVHFVKYRTPEEASLAQLQIQAHYEGYHGRTADGNIGVESVSNYKAKTPESNLNSQTFSNELEPISNYAAIAGTSAAETLDSNYESSASKSLLANTLMNTSAYRAAYTSTNWINAIDDRSTQPDTANYKINERFRNGPKMVFPTEPTVHNADLLSYKRIR